MFERILCQKQGKHTQIGCRSIEPGEPQSRERGRNIIYTSEHQGGLPERNIPSL